MRLLFSEYKSDYPHYIFPYAIWAVPESGETPDLFFGRGFLPGSKHFDRYYLCRHVRVDLRAFQASSENRRVLRKGEGIRASLVPRAEFDYSAARRAAYKAYADRRFGKDMMGFERLDGLFNAPIVSHLLIFHDEAEDREVGTVTLYLQDRIAYYYYAFYDLAYFRRNLGMYMMTSAVQFFHKAGMHWLYLGSAYSRNALYKTQFSGAEFFTGTHWSANIGELKYLIERDGRAVSQHLLENPDYLQQFYDGELTSQLSETGFRMPA